MKRLCALLLTLALVVGLLPVTAWAEGPDGAEAVTVRVSFYDGGATQSFLMAPREMAVAPGTAAAKGYATPQLTANADRVTVFDALVAVHEYLLGDGEPVDQAMLQGLLSISESGWLTQVMGEEGRSFSFALNGVTPNDGVYNEAYQGYTGYTADQAVLARGDVLEFFFYEDTDTYSDYYATLEPSKATVYVGQPMDISASGYMICWYGASTPEIIAKKTLPLEGASLCVVDETGALTPLPDAVTDETGQAAVVFDQAGTYALSLRSEMDYVIAPWLEVTVEELPTTTITVPSDAAVFVGKQGFPVQSYQPLEEVASLFAVPDKAAGTTTYYYDWAGSGYFYYRITGDFIPYGGILTKGKAVTVTQEQLKPQGVTRSTIERDIAANNGFNVADIYLNINARGHLKLEPGETYQLVSLRNWQAVNTVTANRFMEPDYHYTVLDESGQPSGSVVDISAGGLITAKAAGTAIVLVTYDAMHYADGVGGPFFGAIWPENTGVFVVTVGGPDGDLDTGMTLNPGKNTIASKLSGDALDGELDILYFTGETGTYTFTPGTQGCEVWVANPTIDKQMTFTGFMPVQANEDGAFTVPLTQGRNIVKVVQGDKAAYQVITAKRLTITVNGGKPVHPGDALTITFDTLYQPNKLAKLYNGVAGALYTTPEGKLAGSVEGGNTGAYTVADYQVMSTYVTKESKNTNWGDQVDYVKGDALTVPANYSKATYTLTGGVMAVLGNGYCGEYGLHREITLTGTTPTPRSTGVKDAVLGQLPDIVIPITRNTPSTPDEDRDQITVTFTLLGDQVHGTPTQATGTHTKKDNNLETWLEKREVKVDRGAKVIDVVSKALDQADIPYENPDGTYITSVRGLAELSNGSRSGWKYTLNGKYPSLGVARQGVKEGDDIIFHYTDDYSRDDDPAPSTPSKPSHGGGGGASGTGGSTGKEVQEPVLDQAPVDFQDVPADHWARQAVEYVSKRDLFQGTDGHTFSPEMPMSRAMLATVLYRMAGATAQGTHAFPDVEEDAWYTDAVIWAAGAEIVTGDETGFAPQREITRQELAVMLYRYAERKNAGMTVSDKLNSFTDKGEVAPWAMEAMAWAVESGLLRGRSGGALAPTDTATRAEVAVILERMAALLDR